MSDRTGGRFKDRNWTLPTTENGRIQWDHVSIAVLMDIRDELKQLNGLLSCQNFLGIPHTLNGIKRNTAKPRKKRKAKP